MTKDYYELLGVSPSASDTEIRVAYKKAALQTHPDRFPTGSTEEKEATQRFQEVNDAYYVLSDKTRRKKYDGTRSKPSSSQQKRPNASYEDMPGGYASSFFKDPKDAEEGRKTYTHQQFEQAFAEMFREAGFDKNANKKKDGRYIPFYTVIGGASGAALGFIFANVPGAIAGGAAGSSLGRLRDKHGQSVYDTFLELPHGERAALIGQILARLASSSTSF